MTRVRVSSPRTRRFHGLMPFRVREVLLVASPYDAFILEEDGMLSEQIFLEYRDVNLSGSPRFTHAPTGEATLAHLKEARYDLIVAMTRLADMSVNDIGRRVKELRPGRPVIVLALDRRELEQARPGLDPQAVDRAFLWTGDSSILLAIINYVEDRENVAHDVASGNVRVIIVVEDSPSYYSSFLGMLYKELMRQGRSLYAEGVNELQRRLHMRSRPKVLLATSFEEGVQLFRQFRDNVMAVISDADIPRQGRAGENAGLDLVRFVRQERSFLPVLLQSSDSAVEASARDLGCTFVDKSSARLLSDIGAFLSTNLGFGDFVFRLPDGSEVARARDLRELRETLVSVPEPCFVFHAQRDHFSVWLLARSEFELAERLRQVHLDDFETPESARQLLLDVLDEADRSAHDGAISDFDRHHFRHDPLARIGHESMGGKARGIAFLSYALTSEGLAPDTGLPVSVPKTVVVTTEYFQQFLDLNALRDMADGCGQDDEELEARFMAAMLPAALREELAFVADSMGGPLAVRSSSLLEDSLYQPFAGIYTTIMLCNNDASTEIRHRQLFNAVKLVYASTYSRDARAYLSNTGYRVEEEAMGVVIQRLVGRTHGTRFYPTFSGLAQSYNFYPVGAQRPDDGIAHLALGLGRLVVDGGLALRFCPRKPRILPQLSSPAAMLKTTQRGFYALDLTSAASATPEGLRGTCRCYPLEAAEEDGQLAAVGSVLSADDQRLGEDLSVVGPRVISFQNILQHGAIPLAETLSALLERTTKALGCPTELELACEMGDWGRQVIPGIPRIEPRLFLLQVRPFAALAPHGEVAALMDPAAANVCLSVHALGHGVIGDVRDIVLVRPDRWEARHNKAIAAEVGMVNEALAKERRHYCLVGPGRWGSADPWLGIPVTWSQISGVRVIVEASPAGYLVEPSQGSHFFQNVTSLGIGYLSIAPGATREAPQDGSFVDWEWLGRQPAALETRFLRLIRREQPLSVVIDGTRGRGCIAAPAVSAGASG